MRKTVDKRSPSAAAIVGDAVYNRVLEIVRRVLRSGDVDPALDFLDNGASSLALVHIVELVRSECGADVWITDALDALDIESFARLVVARSHDSA
ncbi:phosphopantetheine-binding protein [Streptomyces sp. NPDC056661]|uniref:phosphopantetheine-binding protein n=1 Tax=Streptomyces sp. NPDC056661 TaxID=3345898 RepID=UPI00368ED6ED